MGTRACSGPLEIICNDSQERGGLVIGQLIRSIRVRDLFGLYTYDLPEDGKSLRDAAILYGDNGVGKSTILRLVFHLLSPADKKSHRTALTKVPYRSLEVELTSGVVFRVEREGAVDSTAIVLTIHRGTKALAEWNFDSTEKSSAHEVFELGKIALSHSERSGNYTLQRLPDGKLVLVSTAGQPKKTHPRGETAYMAELGRNVPTVFLLNADRRLDSDSVSDPSDEVELRRVLRYEDLKRVNDLVVRSREIGLSQALGTAVKWISKQAVQGANRGSTNVHGVYVNVLRQLGAPSSRVRDQGAAVDPEALLQRLLDIETRSQELAKYEFTPALPTVDFRKALKTTARGKRELAANLLKPYADSLEGRLAALDNIYRLVDSFVTIVNGFLSDKSLSFKLSSGFRISNRLGHDLGARQLSSGEQQLLLLFCYVLTARDQPSVFIIDEPEISLNVKWQRRLVQSLLDITRDAQIQFIFASHSMELLAQHRARVVQLESRND